MAAKILGALCGSEAGSKPEVLVDTVDSCLPWRFPGSQDGTFAVSLINRSSHGRYRLCQRVWLKDGGCRDTNDDDCYAIKNHSILAQRQTQHTGRNKSRR